MMISVGCWSEAARRRAYLLWRVPQGDVGIGATYVATRGPLTRLGLGAHEGASELNVALVLVRLGCLMAGRAGRGRVHSWSSGAVAVRCGVLRAWGGGAHATRGVGGVCSTSQSTASPRRKHIHLDDWRHVTSLASLLQRRISATGPARPGPWLLLLLAAHQGTDVEWRLRTRALMLDGCCWLTTFGAGPCPANGLMSSLLRPARTFHSTGVTCHHFIVRMPRTRPLPFAHGRGWQLDGR